MNGWRTAVFNEKTTLMVKDRLLISESKQKTMIPMEQLRQVMISSPGSVLTAGAITEAAKDHIRILFCGEKHTPICEMIPIVQHHEASGAIMDQAEWRTDRKEMIWKAIVEAKLKNQLELLKQLSRDPSPKFREYLNSVQPGDATHREAIAARMYFGSLFGHEFRRHAKDDINGKLNYGYTILCSAVSRILAMHGYHTGLGIHHCSRDNPVNLSCDLMEPFRPFVDRIVFESGDQPIDWDMRKRLIGITETECTLDGKRTSIDAALELYCLDTLNAVKNGKEHLMEVGFG